MSVKTTIALLLAAAGILVLVFSGLSFDSPGESLEVMGLRFETTERHFIPPWAGLVVLLAGILLYFLPLSRRKPS